MACESGCQAGCQRGGCIGMVLAVLLGLLIGSVLSVGLQGCEKKPAPDPVVEYTVRGILTNLPSVNEPSQIYARHEAIPEFRQASGQFGMSAMTMPFPLPATGVSLDGLTVGDVVKIRFAVTYSADFKSLQGYVVRSIERLPEGTDLDFTPLDELPGFDPATGRVGEPG